MATKRQYLLYYLFVVTIVQGCARVLNRAHHERGHLRVRR